MKGRRGDYLGKRPLDFVLAGVGIVVTMPIMVVTGAAVRATSPGPALHRVTRVGRDGRMFTLFKFRSMYVGADQVGPAVTASGDGRVTRVGRVIRRTKLDELPQLFNVLIGDMSVVGPRPEDPRYVDHYSLQQREILRWRPGITSPASVTFRNEESVLAAAGDLHSAYAVISARKVAIDLAYFRTASFTGDVRWIGRTIAAVAGMSDSSDDEVSGVRSI